VNKIIILTLIILSLCPALRAQALTRDTSFVVNYPYHLGANFVRGIIEEPDDSFLLYGNITNLGGSYPVEIVKFYSNGNVDFNFQPFPQIGDPVDYVKRTDYGYFINGINQRTRKLDFNTGLLVDSTYYYVQNNSNPAYCGIRESGQNSILLKGDSVFWGGYCCTKICPYWFFKVTPQGWLDTTFTKDTNGPVASIWEYSDSTMMIAGLFTEYDGQPANRIFRMDKQGNLDTTFFQNIVVAGGGGIIYIDSLKRIYYSGGFKLAGSNDTLGTIRLLPNGNLDSTYNNTAFFNKPGQNIYSICPTLDGGYLMGGSFSEYDGYSRGSIVKTDANGYIDTSYFTGSGFEHQSTGTGSPPMVFSITPGNNDKYYVSGFFDTYNGNFTPFIIRLHDSSVSVEEIENEKMDFEIYPNPANEKIKLKLEDFNKPDNMFVTIYNLYGAVLKIEPLNSNITEIDIRELSNGMYFISIQSATKKLIVQH
jgi:hypothetical protein